MLNDAQLETAARRYCHLMALDPDEDVQYVHPDGKTMMMAGKKMEIIMTSPRWTRHVQEIQLVAAMTESIEFAVASDVDCGRDDLSGEGAQMYGSG
jgi:hypothetical protein